MRCSGFIFILLTSILSVGFMLYSCGSNKIKKEPEKKDSAISKPTYENYNPAYDTTGRIDSLNGLVVEKTETLTLISGHHGPDGANFEFRNSSDTLMAREIPDVVKWEEDKNGFEDIKKEYLNKKYNVSYKLQTLWYEPGGLYEDIIVISKMEKLK